MESKILEAAPPNAPSYEEVMKYSTVPPPAQMHPYPIDMLGQYQPQLQPQPPVQHMQPIIQNFNIGGGLAAACGSCHKPLHTRVGYVSTCSTHCGFLLCCLFLCLPCAPFVYCTKSCREPRLFCVNCGERI